MNHKVPTVEMKNPKNDAVTPPGKSKEGGQFPYDDLLKPDSANEVTTDKPSRAQKPNVFVNSQLGKKGQKLPLKAKPILDTRELKQNRKKAVPQAKTEGENRPANTANQISKDATAGQPTVALSQEKPNNGAVSVAKSKLADQIKATPKGNEANIEVIPVADPMVKSEKIVSESPGKNVLGESLRAELKTRIAKSSEAVQSKPLPTRKMVHEFGPSMPKDTKNQLIDRSSQTLRTKPVTEKVSSQDTALPEQSKEPGQSRKPDQRLMTRSVSDRPAPAQPAGPAKRSTMNPDSRQVVAENIKVDHGQPKVKMNIAANSVQSTQKSPEAKMTHTEDPKAGSSIKHLMHSRREPDTAIKQNQTRAKSTLDASKTVPVKPTMTNPIRQRKVADAAKLAQPDVSLKTEKPATRKYSTVDRSASEPISEAKVNGQEDSRTVKDSNKQHPDERIERNIYKRGQKQAQHVETSVLKGKHQPADSRKVTPQVADKVKLTAVSETKTLDLASAPKQNATPDSDKIIQQSSAAVVMGETDKPKAAKARRQPLVRHRSVTRKASISPTEQLRAKQIKASYGLEAVREKIADPLNDNAVDILKQQLHERINVLKKAQESVSSNQEQQAGQHIHRNMPMKANLGVVVPAEQVQNGFYSKTNAALFARSFASEMVEKIRTITESKMAGNDGVKTRFVVDGGQAGQLDIEFQQESGKDQITIFVETENSRNELIRLMPQIEDNLQQRGFSLAGLDVEVKGDQKESGSAHDAEEHNSQSNKQEADSSEKGMSEDNKSVTNRKYGYNTMEVLA